MCTTTFENNLVLSGKVVDSYILGKLLDALAWETFEIYLSEVLGEIFLKNYSLRAKVTF